MLATNDFVNIILPVLSHWVIWLIFLIIVVIGLFLYTSPHIKKSEKESHRLSIGVPILSIISLYLFTKMLEGVIYNGSILKIDEWFNSINFALYFPLINKAAMFITIFGDAILIILFFILVLGVLILKKRWRYALISTLAIVGASVFELIIKFLVHRARPQNLIETGFSFPSGHAVMAIIFACLLIYSFKDDFKDKLPRYIFVILTSVFFISVGISRIILQVHWFSDIVAGMSLSLFWFMFLVIAERAVNSFIAKSKKL
jgi:undecaprenyl-diphosphatase